MNLQDMKAFIAFAETGSVVRAAQRIRLTQSATTRRIQRFEASLRGASLLDRAVKPPTLTPTGRDVLQKCRLLLDSFSELTSIAAGDSLTGEVRIGVAQGFGDTVLGTPIEKFCRQFPQLSVHVTAGWSAQLLEQVRTGGLDYSVGVLAVGSLPPEGVRCEVLGIDQLVAYAGPAHELAKNRRTFTLAQLAAHPWVLHPPGCGYRAALQRVADNEGLDLRIAAEVYERELRLSLISRGIGLGLGSCRALEAAPARLKLRRIDVAGMHNKFQVMVFTRADATRYGKPLQFLTSTIKDQLR